MLLISDFDIEPQLLTSLISMSSAAELNAFTSDDCAPEGDAMSLCKRMRNGDISRILLVESLLSRVANPVLETLHCTQSRASAMAPVFHVPDTNAIAARVNAAQQSGPRVDLPYLSYKSAGSKSNCSKVYAASGETVSVNITVGYLKEGKPKKTILSGLTDSIRDLDTSTTVPEIRAVVVNLMRSTIDQIAANVPKFLFNFQEINLHETSNKLQVDMDGLTLDQRQPYFQPACMKEDKKTHQQKFVWPPTPFRLILIISVEEWDCYQSALEEQEHKKIPSTTWTATGVSSWNTALSETSEMSSAMFSAIVADLLGADSDARTSIKRPCSADLRFESELGVEAFKTCHPATLICSEEVMPASNSIVMKILYENKGTRMNGKVVNWERYAGVDEFEEIIIEANVHYHVVALMEFAYAYIECQKQLKGPPGLPILNLRYVEAAVFVVLSDKIKHSRSRTTGPKCTYLLEERIAILPGQDFIKYIHNSNPVPAIALDHTEYTTALFLVAVQHLQYKKTHENAYVSDFQGYGRLLSDPQIIFSTL
ncbi:hypothetical protein D9758_017367 [Tetrapyrgos nigripes]|uniref:Alpha-type protein kinase domain-containing protein n=1 Tax=Tetrapyrgos nigripes TaxID=182062 RepID=A0A8H5BZV2_9AGAR|nr:hypothetical protein D9758_017367 [Tetrapyrgos nigripes]